MDWILWALAMGSISVPILALLLDRMADMAAPAFLRRAGIPAAAVFAGVLAVTFVRGDLLFNLILWGIIGSLLGSVFLDIVRLLGVHLLKAFPLDMPMIFGLIALNRAQQMQTNMMVRMVAITADMPEQEREKVLTARVAAIARLTPVSRGKVVRGMMAGIAQLDADRRDTILQTQMGALVTLDPSARRAMMRSMDEAMSASAQQRIPYGQPWGMLRIPMYVFREMAEIALPQTAKQTGTSLGKIAWTGYAWHFLNGISLIAPYVLLFGSGNWALAIAWGTFIWFGMMVTMPFMMRMIAFPWWFPIIPFIAHIAMMVPIALLAPHFLQGAPIDNSPLGRWIVP